MVIKTSFKIKFLNLENKSKLNKLISEELIYV